jgi:hypothetical protein
MHGVMTKMQVRVVKGNCAVAIPSEVEGDPAEQLATGSFDSAALRSDDSEMYHCLEDGRIAKPPARAL